jgi:hypothetical protein
MFLGIPWAQELKKEISTVNAGRDRWLHAWKAHAIYFRSDSITRAITRPLI